MIHILTVIYSHIDAQGQVIPTHPHRISEKSVNWRATQTPFWKK